MPVYVDPAVWLFGRMVMCHMFADGSGTYEDEAMIRELHAMVDLIGVQRKWIQMPPKASWIHFDIAKGKRELAIANGAIAVDRYECLLHTGKVARAKGNPARYDLMVHRVEQARKSRA
jgi:hypothetical protein